MARTERVKLVSGPFSNCLPVGRGAWAPRWEAPVQTNKCTYDIQRSRNLADVCTSDAPSHQGHVIVIIKGKVNKTAQLLCILFFLYFFSSV